MGNTFPQNPPNATHSHGKDSLKTGNIGGPKLAYFHIFCTFKFKARGFQDLKLKDLVVILTLGVYDPRTLEL